MTYFWLIPPGFLDCPIYDLFSNPSRQLFNVRMTIDVTKREQESRDLPATYRRGLMRYFIDVDQRSILSLFVPETSIVTATWKTRL